MKVQDLGNLFPTPDANISIYSSIEISKRQTRRANPLRGLCVEELGSPAAGSVIAANQKVQLLLKHRRKK